MSNSKRAASVAALIDRKVRAIGGDHTIIDACVRLGLLALDHNHSACRSIQYAVDIGSKIIDGGCHANA